ncbi:hypothetical protein ROZALSC1DRAFT_26609, partial [Rozella allomycis CSF55]
MESLIPIVNKLQDVFNVISHDPIDLPQIVVVGSQSSGKSSVLESLVQRDFLPRGNDIVTRRPLVLQLINESYQNAINMAGVEEWGVFLHSPELIYTDFNEIRKEIEKETQRIAGNNKGISKTPIHLKIYSTKVLNLTLVDLPGITKIPVGDQPDDIEQQIREMIYEYSSRPNSILLAVTPANIDIVNSESLKFAREVDPQGLRTIGVLTKLDLMDQGTSAHDILCNKGPFKLKLGFIGVVNRSQKDINEQKNVIDAMQKELEFFRHHPQYRGIAHRCGSAYLARALNQILVAHIRDRLPELKNKINSLVVSTQHELMGYGDPNFQGNAHRGTLLLRLITKFSNDFCDAVDGTSKNISTSELNALYNIDPCGGLSINDIRTVIRNSTGPRSCLFVPEISFEILVKRQIERLEYPGMRCMELVYDELIKILHQSESMELFRFPNLHKKVIDASSELVKNRLNETSSMIENLVRIELAYINTNHPDFMGAAAAIQALGKMHESKRTETLEKKPTKERIVADENTDPQFTNSTQLPGSIGLPVTAEARRRINKGQEGGFLHYLFGVNHNQEEHIKNKRMSSPVRAMAPVKKETRVLDDELMDMTLSNLELEQVRMTNPLHKPPTVLEDTSNMSEKEQVETQLI